MPVLEQTPERDLVIWGEKGREKKGRKKWIEAVKKTTLESPVLHRCAKSVFVIRVSASFQARDLHLCAVRGTSACCAWIKRSYTALCPLQQPRDTIKKLLSQRYLPLPRLTFAGTCALARNPPSSSTPDLLPAAAPPPCTLPAVPTTRGERSGITPISKIRSAPVPQLSLRPIEPRATTLSGLLLLGDFFDKGVPQYFVRLFPCADRLFLEPPPGAGVGAPRQAASAAAADSLRAASGAGQRVAGNGMDEEQTKTTSA